MLLLFALVAESSSVWADDQTITLDYSSFGLETSYKVKTATVSGFGFTINQGYKGSGSVIQMNSSKGKGILYNTTSIPGLKSIKVNVSSGNKTYTITTGTSEEPTTNSQTGTTGGTYNAASGDSYFQLKVSGASYFSSIEITYTTTHTLTYSATNGSISGVFYNTSTEVASGASVAEGGKVTLTAEPADGYRFDSWNVSGTGSTLSSTTANPTIFTMGTANATVTANFIATTAKITLNAACTDGEKYYGTYSSSKAFVVPSGLTVSEIKIVEGKLDITNYNTDDIVPANTGVMVSSTTSGNHTITLSDEAGTSVLGANNMLKPSGDAGITADGMAAAASGCKYYRLTMHNAASNPPGEIGFWWGAENGAAFALSANKAYLAVPTGGSGAPNLLWFDNGSTGVDEVRGKMEEVRGDFFDLQGRKVANPTKGLYIVDGKKVVVK